MYLIRKCLIATVFDVREDGDADKVDEMDGDVSVEYDVIELTAEQRAAHAFYDEDPNDPRGAAFKDLVHGEAIWDDLRIRAASKQDQTDFLDARKHF